jgi:hypothetical protein
MMVIRLYSMYEFVMCGMCDHAAQSIHNALMYLIADFPNAYIIMTSNHACMYRLHDNFIGS